MVLGWFSWKEMVMGDSWQEGHPEQVPRMLLGVQMPRQDQSIAYLITSK